MDEDRVLRLSIMVDKLTTSRKDGPDQTRLKELKKLCKSSEEYIRHTYHLLIHQLQKEHSEVRINALIVINELFKRSHLFRELLVSSFQQFLELTVETDPEQPLPPPHVAAKALKKKTLDYIQSWYNDFGVGYKKLSLGYTFLKQCKQVDFNDMQARTVVERQREEIRQRHIEDMNRKKTDEAIKEFDTLRPEIDNCLMELESCFRLLMPHPDEFFVKTDQADADLNVKFSDQLLNSSDFVASDVLESCKDESERENGLPDNRFSIEINLNQNVALSANKDNQVVIQNARDLYKLIVGKYKPCLEKLIGVFSKTGQDIQKMRELIIIKERITNAIDKFHELNISTVQVHDSDSESDDFEEVPEKEGYEPVIPQHLRAEYGLEPLPAPAPKVVNKRTEQSWSLGRLNKGDIHDPTTIAAQPGCSSIVEDNAVAPFQVKKSNVDSKSCDSKRAKLLEVAPKLRYDMDLYVWEEKNLEPPSVEKFESLHRFWAPMENRDSKTVKEEEVASLRRRIIDFSGKFEQVKWKCRAPLPSGRLCPRQDRKKCPFHGPIIPRDSTGSPTEESDKKKEQLNKLPDKSEDWQDPKLLEDIKAQIGVDLKIEKKNKGGKGKKTKRKKQSDLTDIKKTQDTTRSRLEKKLLNASTMKRVELSMNSEKQKLYDDKFGNQWNYSFNG